MEILKKIIKQQKRIEGIKITKGNKEKAFKQLKSISKNFSDVNQPTKGMNVSELKKLKKALIERNGYDILVESVRTGKHIIAERYAEDLKKSQDKDIKRLAENSKKLSNAMYNLERRTNKETKKILQNSNYHILGYGDRDIITEFENTKNQGQVNKLVKKIENVNANKDLADYNKTIVNRVFGKINVVEEKDIKKIQAYLDKNSPTKQKLLIDYLMESLELYGSDSRQETRETELAKNRLNDVMIKFGMKKGSIKSVKSNYKRFKK